MLSRDGDFTRHLYDFVPSRLEDAVENFTPRPDRVRAIYGQRANVLWIRNWNIYDLRTVSV